MQSSPHSRHPRSKHLRIAAVWVLFSAPGLAMAQSAPVPAQSVPLLLPSAIAYDSAGNLYIAETQRHVIRRVDVFGNITSFAGDSTQGFGGDGGPATGSHLDSPRGVAVDGSGNVYITDSGNNRVRRVDAVSNLIQTVAGGGTSALTIKGGPALSASLSLPGAICLDPAGLNLYIADTGNHRIRHVDLTAGTIETIAGDGVQGFSGDGALATSASLDSPDSLALDRNNNLYLADTHNLRLRRVAADTKLISTVIQAGAAGLSGAPSVTSLRGVAVDAAGNIYVADSGNHRLFRVDHASGLVSVAAGSATQGFAGDAGPAALAALDSPRAIALSPGGLLSIADAGNQRIRQLLEDPAPSTSIQTIAGLGAVIPNLLSLSAPAVTAYGSGTLTASLLGTRPASGQVTFLDTVSGSSLLIGASPLAGNLATLSLASLSAGQHRVMATYPGDPTHPAARTSASPLTISPLTLRSTPASAAMIYGSATPALTGSIDGLLPQDAAQVAASFTTTAVPLSPAGTYPISTALTGAAAPNYLVQSAPANLVITEANSITLLRNGSADGSFAGTILADVSSTTSGTPRGLVTLLDNGIVLGKSTVSALGSAAFSQVPLSAGTHTLSAFYSGDRNFLPSASAPLDEFISTAPAADFAITATDPGPQLLAAGGSVSYTLSVQMTGAALSSPVALSVSGLPAFTKAAFTPAYLPPGAGKVTPLTLVISSLATSAMHVPQRNSRGTSSVLALALPLFGVLLRRRRGSIQTRSVPTLAVALLALFFASSLIGCGARINTASQTSSSPQSYTLTVTGTATDSQGSTLAHSASIVLTMNAAH